MHLLDDTLLVHDIGLEPQHSEHYQSGQDGGKKVDDGNQCCIKVAVIVSLVVTGESDDAAKAQSERKEDLRSCFSPHLWFQHLLQLERQKEEKIVKFR